MPKKIAILTSGHPTHDERLFNKFGHTLVNFGFSPTIVSTVSNYSAKSNEINQLGKELNSKSLSAKMRFFKDQLSRIQPELIICAEVLPIYPAIKYRKQHPNCKVIYDVTEWFPESLKHTKSRLDLFKYPVYNFFSRRLIAKTDGLIFGESRKIEKFNSIIVGKPAIALPYFPVLKNFNYSSPDIEANKITLAFTGLLTEERGLFRILTAAETIWNERKEIDLKLLFVGKFLTEVERQRFELIRQKYRQKIRYNSWVEYEKISDSIAGADVCVDLRTRNFVYENSLPIKIFEYIACGKPVVYSNIRAIREDLPIDEFGKLVDPENNSEIVNVIANYAKDKTLLKKHSKRGRALVEEKYCWENLERDFIEFIKALV